MFGKTRRQPVPVYCPSNCGEPVYVCIYDLILPNGMKTGTYHTGVVVYGKEYGYGGHPYSTGGIFQSFPRDTEMLGDSVSFKQSIYVGSTYLSEPGVQRLISSLEDEFRGDAYHLLKFNCNDFTAQFIETLAVLDATVCDFGNPINLLCNGVLPSYINRAARIASSIPLIERMVPAHWIRPSLRPDDFYFDEPEMNGTVQSSSPSSASSNTSPKS